MSTVVLQCIQNIRSSKVSCTPTSLLMHQLLQTSRSYSLQSMTNMKGYDYAVFELSDFRLPSKRDRAKYLDY